MKMKNNESEDRRKKKESIEKLKFYLKKKEKQK